MGARSWPLFTDQAWVKGTHEKPGKLKHPALT